MLLLLFIITLVQGKTVRYSNVPPRAAIATKTYDLEVPGSAPIRIIEAEPIWTTEIPETTPYYRDDIEHRGTKPKTGKAYFTTQSTRTTISEPVTHEPEHSTVYSPEALNSFLKEYAQRVKADRKKFSIDDNDDNSDHFVTEEPINKLASIYLDNEEKANEEDKQKSWGLIDVQHHNHPYEDKKGWVSLEAVPWSTSKISKWQSKNKNEPKPWETNRPHQNTWNNKPVKNSYFENANTNSYNGHKNSYHGNSNPYKGGNNNYNSNHNPFQNNYNNHNINDKNYFTSNSEEEQYNPNDNIFQDKPVATYDQDIHPSNDFPFHDFPSRPSYPERPQMQQHSRPTYGYDAKPIKIKPEPANNWPDEMPSRPSFILRPSSSQSQSQSHSQWNNNNKPIPDPWLDRNPTPQFMYVPQNFNKDENRDIITDGRPGDFPKPAMPTMSHFSTYEQPQQQTPQMQKRPSNSDHPPSHPLNGNGEWVLVSTTKGYQYPRTKHQRSIEVTPDSIGTRRGIRLTVLPPDEDSNLNMTTSHGGLLEVESTFETVEESQNKFTEIQLQRKNKTEYPALPHVHKKKPSKTHVLVTTKPIVTSRPLPPKPVLTMNNGNRRPTAVKPVVIHDKQDATALMAAVGAGMIPATMAMLVPFVTGRRRRRSIETNLERTVKIPVNFFTNTKFN